MALKQGPGKMPKVKAAKPKKVKAFTGYKAPQTPAPRGGAAGAKVLFKRRIGY